MGNCMIGRVQLAAVAVGAGLVLAGCGGSASQDSGAASPTTPSDGRLTIGTAFADTGDAAANAAMQAGVQVAVKEINKAGGVTGERVRLITADLVAPAESAGDLVDRNTDVLVGAGDSEAVPAMLDVTIPAGVMFVSPSDGADALSDRDNQGLFWRTVAPDRFQAAVLAESMGEKQTTVVATPASAALAESVLATLAATGSPELVEFEPETGDPAVTARRVKRTKPQAVVLVGTESGIAAGQLIQALADQGVNRPLYLLDNVLTSQLAGTVPDDATGRTTGLMPGSELVPELRKLIDAADANLVAYPHAPQAYDAVVVSALAAVAAASDRAGAIAVKMLDVTTGGTACDDFAECERLLGEGKDINYDGPSGPLEFQPNGDPGQAVVGLYRIEDGAWVPDQYVEGTVPPPLAPAPSPS